MFGETRLASTSAKFFCMPKNWIILLHTMIGEIQRGRKRSSTLPGNRGGRSTTGAGLYPQIGFSFVDILV